MENKPELLIVDDEQNIRTGLQVGISWSDIGIGMVYSAENGEAALRIMEEKNIAIVISDIHMSGVDGIELGNRIAQLYPQVKIILLSGYSEFEYAQHAVRFGAVDYMLKPVKIDELTKRVSDIVTGLTIEKQKDMSISFNMEDIACIKESRGLMQHEKFFGVNDQMSIIKRSFSPMTLLTIDYVNTRYCENINVESVARYVGKSNNYFSSQFKKELGMPFVEYLTRVRVEQAKLLLEHTTMMTYEISDQLGFNDYKYFSTVFKKYTGISPSQHRKPHAGEN